MFTAQTQTKTTDGKSMHISIYTTTEYTEMDTKLKQNWGLLAMMSTNDVKNTKNNVKNIIGTHLSSVSDIS